MEYMTGSYRQKEATTALLLQQYVCRGVPVCLGCICGGTGRRAGMTGGWFTGQLLEEFRGIELSRADGRGEKLLKKMERRLDRCGGSGMTCPGFWTAGIVCQGEGLLLFAMGEVRFSLCNSGFGRPALQEIGMGKREGEEGRLWIQRGAMEAGIGILIASDSFYKSIPQEDMQECLAVKDIRDPGQAQRRLLELGRAAERNGGRGMAAVLVEVR